MFATVKLVRGCLIDRHCNRGRLFITTPAGVKCDCFRVLAVNRHSFHPLIADAVVRIARRRTYFDWTRDKRARRKCQEYRGCLHYKFIHRFKKFPNSLVHGRIKPVRHQILFGRNRPVKRRHLKAIRRSVQTQLSFDCAVAPVFPGGLAGCTLQCRRCKHQLHESTGSVPTRRKNSSFG